MMKQVLVIILFFYSINIGAIEMVCGESSYRDKNNIFVNCQSRFEIIKNLKDSWLLLRKNYIGGQLENLCYEAYMDAKKMHPSIDLAPMVDVFFVRCNMGLEHLK